VRIPRKSTPVQPLLYMWEKHKEIARLEVCGMRPIDISRKMGMTPCRISIIMNSKVYREYRDTLSEKRNAGAFDMKAELERGAEIGVKKLVEFLDDEEVAKPVKARIAQDFLDRTGFGKTSTVNNNTTVVHCTTSRIEALKAAQRELLSGMKVIDLSPEAANG